MFPLGKTLSLFQRSRYVYVLTVLFVFCRYLDSNFISEVTKGWLYGLNSLHQLFLSYNKIQTLDTVWEFCLELGELYVPLPFSIVLLTISYYQEGVETAAASFVAAIKLGEIAGRKKAKNKS